MTEAAIDEALQALPVGARSRILETGCGNGELLRRAARICDAADALGVDLDPDAIAEARARSDTGPVRFEVMDGGHVCGRFEAVLNVAASHAHGGFPAALDHLRALGPVVLYGEGFWRHKPSEGFLAALGGASADELADMAGLRAAARHAGFQIVHESCASEADWAAYEEALASNAERHGGAETAAYARRIRERRALPDGTDTLGFALLVLSA
jgi:SAM-dependent methyltransferase